MIEITTWTLANLDALIAGFVGTCAFVFTFGGLKHAARWSVRSVRQLVNIKRRETANWVWRMWKSPAWLDEIERRQTACFRHIVILGFLYYWFRPELSDLGENEGQILERVEDLILTVPQLFIAGLWGGELGDFLKLTVFRSRYFRLKLRYERRGQSVPVDN
jgi:hypothetical protein